MTQSNSCELSLLQELCWTDGGGELNAVARDLARDVVGVLCVAGTDENAFRGALHCVQHGADAGVERRFRLNGFRDEAEGAGLERALARFLRRDDAGWNVPGRKLTLEAAHDTPAVHVGQVDVEGDEIGGEVARKRQRRGTLRRDQPLAAVVARGLEQNLCEGEVVLDDEHHAVAGLYLVAVVVGLVDEEGMLGSLREREVGAEGIGAADHFVGAFCRGRLGLRRARS